MFRNVSLQPFQLFLKILTTLLHRNSNIFPEKYEEYIIIKQSQYDIKQTKSL